jgi:hypothetical protein
LASFSLSGGAAWHDSKRYAEDADYREKVCAAARKQRRLRRGKNAQKLESDPEFREKERKDRAEKRLRLKYGLAKGDYERMLLRQHGVCAICEQKPRARLCVDHCHSTRQVRGLLCRKCNLGLGHFHDDPRLLRKAAAYLEDRRKTVDSAASRLATQPPGDPVCCDQLELFPPARMRPAPVEPAYDPGYAKAAMSPGMPDQPAGRACPSSRA